MMAKNKTTATENSVWDFINAVPDELKRSDGFKLIELIKRETGYEPKMWGPSIIGFGSYHYKYISGHEGDAPLIGFSPRKTAISLYLASNFENKDQLLQSFGKHKASVGCIYINTLDDIDIDVLKEMIRSSVSYLKLLYPDHLA